MIEFRQKGFAFPLIPLIASTGASIGVSAAQGGVHHKKDMAQQEEFQRQQSVEAKKQNEALNRIAKAAEKDPEKAQQAAAVIQQKGFAAPVNPSFFRKYGQVVYDFGHAINNTGGGKQISKKLGTGLAMGTTMAALGYGVDKAIQADRKRITGGAPLPKPEASPEEKRKKRNKTLGKIALGTAAVGGTVLAARRGALGKGFKNLSHGRTANGKKIQGFGKNVASEYKKGFAEQFVTKNPETGKNQLNGIGLAFTLGFPALGAVGYLGGERGQLKSQTQQQQQVGQRQYAEPAPQQEGNKTGSVLKKVAIGGAAAAGVIAAGRRGALGAKTGRYLNDWYMSRGRQINKLSKGKYGNKMMLSGSELWDKYNKKAMSDASKKIADIKSNPGGRRKLFDIFRSRDAVADRNVERVKKLNEGINKYKYVSGVQRLADVRSGKVHTSLTNSVASGISSFYGTGGQKGTQAFLEDLSKNKAYGATTRKVADKMTKGTYRTLATVGAVGVGSLAFKPFEWGDKVVRAPLKAVDKNAFAYEESKNQEV